MGSVMEVSGLPKSLCRWVALLLIMPAPGIAQSIPPDTIGVFFDEFGTRITDFPPLYDVNNQFWSLGIDLSEPYRGYEYSLSIDPHVIVLTVTIPSGAVDLDGDPSDQNWIVETAQCTNGLGVQTLTAFTYGIFVSAPTDLFLCIVPPVPSSLDPPVPAYRTCDGELRPLQLTQLPDDQWNGCGVLYPSGCSSPPLWKLLVQAGRVTADPGALAPVPLYVSNPEHCGHPAAELSEISISLTWDPSVASLESLELAQPISDWQLIATISDGSAEILAQGNAVVAPRQPEEWVTANFRALNTGSTSISPTLTACCVPGDTEFTRKHGVLIVSPLATGKASFGAIKARF